jgi:hypothetical protein
MKTQLKATADIYSNANQEYKTFNEEWEKEYFDKNFNPDLLRTASVITGRILGLNQKHSQSATISPKFRIELVARM